MDPVWVWFDALVLIMEFPGIFLNKGSNRKKLYFRSMVSNLIYATLKHHGLFRNMPADAYELSFDCKHSLTNWIGTMGHHHHLNLFIIKKFENNLIFRHRVCFSGHKIHM